MLAGRPELVIIDVDGTLVDSVPDLAWCVDETMRRIGRAPHGEARVREWVGNGVERLVERALAGSLDGRPDPADFERAYPIFLELYAENTSRRSRLYPGAAEALAALAEGGYRLAAVTNKARRFTEPLLRDLGVRERLALVVCGDDCARKKPDPEPLLCAARHFGLEPGRCLMVGDSVNDVRAARAAGMPVVCVSYGYNHGRDIREAAPDAVIDSLLELQPILEQAA